MWLRQRQRRRHHFPLHIRMVHHHGQHVRVRCAIWTCHCVRWPSNGSVFRVPFCHFVAKQLWVVDHRVLCKRSWPRRQHEHTGCWVVSQSPADLQWDGWGGGWGRKKNIEISIMGDCLGKVCDQLVVHCAFATYTYTCTSSQQPDKRAFKKFSFFRRFPFFLKIIESSVLTKVDNFSDDFREWREVCLNRILTREQKKKQQPKIGTMWHFECFIFNVVPSLWLELPLNNNHLNMSKRSRRKKNLLFRWSSSSLILSKATKGALKLTWPDLISDNWCHLITF